MNLIPKRKIKEILTLFLFCSTLTKRGTSEFLPVAIPSLSWAFWGRKEMGHRANPWLLHCYTTHLTVNTRGWPDMKTQSCSLIWSEITGFVFCLDMFSTKSGGIINQFLILQSKPNWFKVFWSSVLWSTGKTSWDYHVAHLLPFYHWHPSLTLATRVPREEAFRTRLKYELDFKKVWNRYWIYWSAMSRKIHW